MPLKISKLGTHTAWVEDADTTNQLSVKICDTTNSNCCETPLNNGKQPFKYGKYDYFEESYLGNCLGFSLSKSHNYDVTITTDGYNGWLGLTFDIIAINGAGKDEVLACPINRWLDDKESIKLPCKWKGNCFNLI